MKFILKYRKFNHLVKNFVSLILFGMLGVSSVYSQQLSKDELGKIMNKIPNLVRENFVVPEIATKTADGIENNFKSGKYNKVSDYDELVKTVTKDLQTLSDDLHLYLRKVEPSKTSQGGVRRVRRMNPGSRSSRSFDRFKNSEGKIISYKKLDGNILYINVAVFAPLETIESELKEALEQSKKADAVIIDLRKCPGGAGDSMEYLAGGFLEKETLLSKHFQKNGGFESRSTKTPYGKINNTKPLYVLTSNRSFSAAEAFAFFMQEIDRVKVVGVQTRGGGRTTRMYPVNDFLNISISDSIAVSSKGNQFQGIGVKPDIPTLEDNALDVAHETLVNELISQNPNQNTELKRVAKTLNKSVCWNEQKLSWDDFQGEVAPQFRRAGMQAAITDAEIRYGMLDRKFKVEAVFNKQNSWMVGNKTESGLKHEQLHFDLAEAYARKARKTISEMKDAAKLDIALKIEAIMQEHDQAQMEYDQDVQMRGLDRTEQQKIWNKKVADLLNLHKDFKTAKPCELPAPGTNLSEDDRQMLIARMIKLIDEKFVDIPAGKRVIKGISQNLKTGKYKNLTTDKAFRKTLTKDLYELSKDLHLSIRPIDRNPMVSAQTSQNSNGRVMRSGGQQRVRMGQNPNGQTTQRRGSYGSPQMRRMGNPNSGRRLFQRPTDGHFIGKILDGNIGYVKVNGALYPTQNSAVKTDMENALKKVKNTDAVIFDLRNVPGGVPDTISLLSSYLYDEKPKLLNTYYHRTRGANELKTEPAKVPFHFGEKLPIYVLINSSTASGGEAFTYLNQQHGRVTVIGETSRGAGRLSAAYPISQTQMLMVPENRSEHPVSKTGFEKVGVKPDIKAKSDDSVYTAHITALERLSGKDKAIAKVKNTRNELLKKQNETAEKFKEYVGVYGIRTIAVKGKELLYKKEGQIDLGLKEISKDKYKLVVPSGVRTAGELPSIRFDRDSSGKVVSFSLIKPDGSVQDTFKKASREN